MEMACETSEVVAANVLALRKRNGLTQQQLAEKCNVSTPRISELESGEINPTVGTLEAIAKALGVTVARLCQPPKRSA